LARKLSQKNLLLRSQQQKNRPQKKLANSIKSTIMPMTTLTIDTSTHHCSVAIVDNAGSLLSMVFEPKPHQQAARLMRMIEAALAQASLHYHQLSNLAVILGPGSFTGLRIGIAAAKALKLSLNIPLYGLTSLEVLATEALHHHPQAHPLWIVQDASRGQCYVQAFTSAGIPITEALLLDDAAANTIIAENPGHLYGSGTFKIHSGKIHTGKIHSGTPLPFNPDTPLAPWIGKRLDFYHNQHLTPTLLLRPLYLRDADAKLPSAPMAR
jgi:tRNA threonylcarbamoyladenosine biosynthesis protein TsaB